jgi:cytochrome oxidase Cu insertion factor (SCO1/SenC/PrrC family)
MTVRAGLWLAALAAVASLTGCGSGAAAGGPAQAQPPAMPMASQAAEANPNLDLGSSLGGQSAPDFRLDNQFGQPMSLSQFRGKVIILAFTDSQCTTVCPLTTASMLQARQLLGAAGTSVQLLGVNAAAADRGR